ncbi:hypothetical protein E2C01_056714 [Portunus trituberculatus]|uniref:Uncharacterized protein n=1 Tax=Portunus trituberculatus TaxID=210409 RepID=A0A5B7GYZ3_PORTR|nr:hypothetical protein [Portunus trituberculatus]
MTSRRPWDLSRTLLCDVMEAGNDKGRVTLCLQGRAPQDMGLWMLQRGWEAWGMLVSPPRRTTASVTVNGAQELTIGPLWHTHHDQPHHQHAPCAASPPCRRQLIPAATGATTSPPGRLLLPRSASVVSHDTSPVSDKKTDRRFGVEHCERRLNQQSSLTLTTAVPSCRHRLSSATPPLHELSVTLA